MLAAVEAARDAARGHEAVLVSHQLPIWTAPAARRGPPLRARPAPPAVRPGQRHVADLRRRHGRRRHLRRARRRHRPRRGARRMRRRCSRCSPSCVARRLLDRRRTPSTSTTAASSASSRAPRPARSSRRTSARPRRSSPARCSAATSSTPRTLAGQVAVINFWGSWCAPCRVETPEFQRGLRRRPADDGVQFLGVNVKETDEQFALAFVDRFGIAFPSLYDPRGEVALAFRDYPANAIPSTIVLDRRVPGRRGVHRRGGAGRPAPGARPGAGGGLTAWGRPSPASSPTGRCWSPPASPRWSG